ncbi:MAG: HI0074 family nucleotidyltransferase substrate-binding subunit [Clostridia bacterium]
MSKFENKFENLQKAIISLKVNRKFTPKSKIEEQILQNSYMHSFEICYELAWKTLKDYLADNGIECQSMPRSVLKAAFQAEIIDDEQVWLQMIKDRNLASHQYNESYIIEIVERINDVYVGVFDKLVFSLGK